MIFVAGIFGLVAAVFATLALGMQIQRVLADRHLRAIDMELGKIAKRLLEIEDARPVNKIELRSDPAVPKDQLFALNVKDFQRWK